jgi:predicted O-methyltransferase YrrM
MSSNFQKFIDRLSNHQIKEIWKNHSGVKRKFFDYLYEDLLKYKNPIILEFGVRHGISTSMFLDVCKQNDGFLYSIDINDYSYKFEKKNGNL